MASNEVKLRLSVDGAAQVVGDVDRVGDKLGTLDSRARQAAQGADTLKTALGAMATMGSVYAMVKMADAVTTLNTQLRLSSNSAAEAAKAYTSLFDIAQKGRVSFVELGTTYAAIARSGKELGVSQERLLTVTQSISQAMTIGGGSAASMQAALVQLGQGLSSGVLRGEELNSIMEQTPRLAKALADGLGVPIGKLRELGAAGQLTGEQVIAALEKAGPQLAKEMESATLTVGQAFTVLTNSVTNFIGIADAASGASGTLAGALKGVSGSIDTAGKAIKENETAFGLITGGLAGAATAVGLALLVKRIYEARTAVVALGVAAAANPVVLAIAAVGAAVGTMAAAADKFTNSAQGMRAEIGSLNNSIANIDATMAKGADKESVAARASSAILRQQLVEKRDAVAQRLAMLGQVEEGEGRFSQAIDKFNRESAKSEEELIALRQKASGVSADYLPTLEKYQTLLKNGKLEEKEYVELVSAFAVKNYKKADSIKAVMAAKKELKDYDAHVHEFTKGNLKAIEDAEKANAKALAEVTKEHEKYIGTLEKSADTIAAQVLKLQDEEAASIIAASQYISLAQAIEQVTIARLQSQADQLSLNGNDAGASAIQREIDGRKKLIGLIGSKEAREANKKAVDELEKANQKAAEESEKFWTDALMRGFESGKSFFDNFWETIKNKTKTDVLRVMVQPVAQGITGIMGLGGSANAGSSAIGTASNAYSAYGAITGGASAFGSAFTAGAALGTEAFSAGVTMMAEATGASSFMAGAGQTLGAIGPVGWAALAAIAVLSLQDHGKPTSSTGDASASFDASGKRTDYQTFFDGSSAGVDKMLADLQAAYAGAAKSLGIGTVASAFAYGGNTGKNGESPNFALTARAGNSFYSTGGETASSDAAIALAASRAVFAALQGSELPAYLSSVFDGLSAGAMTQEQITNTLAYAGSIKQVREALLETREPMAILQANVDQAFSTLATTSESFKTDFVSAIDGGISPEKLAQWQSLQVAMTELASLAEKEATAKEAAAQKVREAVQREVDKEIATVTTWTQKLAVLQGTVTERQLAMQADLATTANAATQELIKQVYAQEDLKTSTEALKEKTDALAATNKSWQDQLDVLTGAMTEHSIALRDAGDDSTRALMQQVYALQDAKVAADQATAAQAQYTAEVDKLTSALEQARSVVASTQSAVDSVRGEATNAYLSSLTAVASAQEALAKAQQDAQITLANIQIDAQIELANAANTAAKEMQDLGKQLREFIDGATLQPSAQFGKLLTAALGGDKAAMQALPGAANSAIDDAKLRAANGTAFALEKAGIVNRVAQVAAMAERLGQNTKTVPERLTAAALDAVAVATTELTIAQNNLAQSLAVANAIGAPLTASVTDLIAKFQAAQAESIKAQQGLLAAQQALDAIRANTGESLPKIDAVATAAAEATAAATAAGVNVSGAVNAMQSVISSAIINNFAKLDTSVNGLLDYAEFAAGLQGLATDSQLKALFTEIDSNGDGQISKLEAIRLAALDIKTATAATATSTATFATGANKTVAFAAGDPIFSVFSNISRTNDILIDSQQLFLTQLLGVGFGENMQAQGAYNSAFLGTYQLQASATGHLQTIAANSAYFSQMASNAATTAANTGNINHTTADDYLKAIRDYASNLRGIYTESYNTNYNWFNNALRVKFDRYGYTGGVYAHGGAFTNSVVSTPTSFDMGLMGEAGPEAIMPLVNIGGNLGVRSAGGNGRDMAKLEALIERLTKEVEGLRTEARATASNTGKTARALDGVIHGEDSINTVAA